MSPRTLRVILLVSCAHALVHVYEHALPSVEVLIGEDFGVGQDVTGRLGTTWRIPFGALAFLVGWTVDRVGSKSMLILYLLGCAATAALTFASTTLPALFVTMFSMGCFASIYHPAGLAIISHETQPQDLPRALGYHGIFGSIGIAGAPFLAAIVLWSGVSWRTYYLFLVVPGVLLAIVLFARLTDHTQPHARGGPAQPADNDEPGQWISYVMLCTVGTITGFVYAGLVHFMPRYLGDTSLVPAGIPAVSFRNMLSSGVLLVGCIGQYVSGRYAPHDRLERTMVLILGANVPCLAWMAVATGWGRVWAAAAFALVHFMHQPVYNSLIASYVPARRRSLGYGISNTVSFGVGAFGAWFTGQALSRWGVRANYLCLALIACAATAMAMLLWLRVRRSQGEGGPEGP